MADEIAERMRYMHQAVHDLQIRQSDTGSENSFTTQFGLMKFDDDPLDSTSRLSFYIRLALQTEADKVVQWMRKAWRLPLPDLIISITGGAKNCDMSPGLRKIFQQGLVEAAVTTNAWLITAATNAGVVKEVGQALNNYRYRNTKQGLDIPCIGIANWNYIAGTDQLDVHNKQIINRSHHSINAIQMEVFDEYCVRSYVVGTVGEGRYDLEPNHTHFLLFDDGQTNANEKLVLSKRAQIEKMIRENVKTDDDLETALVMLLIEGGLSSIQTVCQSLRSDTPLVVIKDSGRAANLIADLHAFFISNRSVDKESDLNQILSAAQRNHPWLGEVKDELCSVLEKRLELVTIFTLESHENLEDAILQGLFNAAKYSDRKREHHRYLPQLRLAMAWQKIEYARKNIFNCSNTNKWTEDELLKGLFEALERGDIHFVDLLIENGGSLQALTVAHLRRLYAKSLNVNVLPMKKRSRLWIPSRDDLYINYFQEQLSVIISLTEKNHRLGLNAAHDLFLWSIYFNRFDLAKYLCSKSWNPTVTFLVGARIYQIAARSTSNLEAKKQFEESAKEFDTYAATVIDRCFDKDEDFAIDIVRQRVVSLANIDPLKLARDANCQVFLASRCVQKYLDNKWFGHINHKRDYIQWRVFFCSIFVPLFPMFCVLLPYVQKHKQLAKSARDPTRSSAPTRIDTAFKSDGGRRKNDEVRWLEKIIYFYQAPIVRFYYNGIFFVLFLGLFSFVLLVDYFPLNISHEHRSGIKDLPIPISEMVLHLWLWSLILEEIRQFCLLDACGEYFSEVWDKIDVIAVVLYLVGLITRLIVDETFFLISKACLCFGLILWYVRLLHYFAAYEYLGPKLVMIYRTMQDLVFFVCFIVIFLFGFSITSWSLISTSRQVKWIYREDGQLHNVTVTQHPEDSFNWQLVRNIMNYGVWKVFGQVDPIEGTDPLSQIAFALAILFVAIANILLLNVLIALFNVTIQNVENRSYTLWRYQRFLIIHEFSVKTPIPPPFSLIYYVFALFRYLARRVQRWRQRTREPPNLTDEGADENLIPKKKIPSSPFSPFEIGSFKISDAMQRECAIADHFLRNILKEEI